MPSRALARAGLASLVTLAACNSITGVNDLTFDGQAGGGAGGSGAATGGAAGAAGQSAGGGASCLPSTPVSSCYACCDGMDHDGKAREAFLAAAPKSCGCPEKCEQDCDGGQGCDGATYSSSGCRACVALSCSSPCGGSQLCEAYVACIEGCGPPGGSNHGSCSQLVSPANCRTCCLGAHKQGFAELSEAQSLKACACTKAPSCGGCNTTCLPATSGTDLACAACIGKEGCPGLCPAGSACQAFLDCVDSCGGK